MSQYRVNVQAFEGPMSVLLSLIESEELEISSVSLCAITEHFLEHLKTVQVIAPHDVADFLMVAARLLYLKSKELLPELVMEEEDETDLASQLRLYQQYAQAADVLADRLALAPTAFLAPRQVVEVRGFFPPKGVSTSGLASIMQGVIDRLAPYVALPEQLLERAVSVEEKIEHLKERIRQQATTYFHDLAGRGSRSDVVVSFLALLELLRQNIVRVEQGGHFEDIAISRL